MSDLLIVRGIGLAALLLATSLGANQTNLRVSVTLDDLPVGPNRHTLEQQEAITGQLIATLTHYDVPAIGFVNESKLDVEEQTDPARVALINAWLDAGLMIGNRGDDELMGRLGRDYVRYLLSVVAFYEDQSRLIEEESIPQILLLHANALNADWLDELLEALAGRGYQWIDIETATRHSAYRQPIDGYTGPAGITWLHRWAITRDLDRQIFRGEPEVPDWVDSLRQENR